MTRAEELIETAAALDMDALLRWVAADLVSPARQGDELLFSDRECARVRLICALRYDMEVEEPSLPVVLSLVDQLYETRARLALLTAAIHRQDEAVRAAIAAAVAERAADMRPDGGR
jgi:chaperone modulatory protein CbpM